MIGRIILIVISFVIYALAFSAVVWFNVHAVYWNDWKESATPWIVIVVDLVVVFAGYAMFAMYVIPMLKDMV